MFGWEVIIGIIGVIFAVVGAAWYVYYAIKQEIEAVEQRMEQKYIPAILYNNDRTLFLDELKGIRNDIKDLLTNLTKRIDDVILSK